MCSQVGATTRSTPSAGFTVDVNASSSSRRLSSWWCSWPLPTSEACFTAWNFGASSSEETVAMVLVAIDDK